MKKSFLNRVYRAIKIDPDLYEEVEHTHKNGVTHSHKDGDVPHEHGGVGVLAGCRLQA